MLDAELGGGGEVLRGLSRGRRCGVGARALFLLFALLCELSLLRALFLLPSPFPSGSPEMVLLMSVLLGLRSLWSRSWFVSSPMGVVFALGLSGVMLRSCGCLGLWSSLGLSGVMLLWWGCLGLWELSRSSSGLLPVGCLPPSTEYIEVTEPGALVALHGGGGDPFRCALVAMVRVVWGRGVAVLCLVWPVLLLLLPFGGGPCGCSAARGVLLKALFVGIGRRLLLGLGGWMLRLLVLRGVPSAFMRMIGRFSIDGALGGLGRVGVFLGGFISVLMSCVGFWFPGGCRFLPDVGIFCVWW